MWLFPINQKKIVVSTFEGDGGYCCNPRYIVEELLKRHAGYSIVWLTHDISRPFPPEIRVVKDTPFNTAYHLSTAKIWIDNYRKPLGTIKRRGQIYIQTWHASLGFKAVGLFRGDKFPKIARIVSEADSNLIDYMVSNSDYCTSIYPKKLLYHGPVLQFGSPRCDCIVREMDVLHKTIRKELELPSDYHIAIYAPTFRGGNQREKKEVTADMPELNYESLRGILHNRFGGEWIIMLRLHPQVSAIRNSMTVAGNQKNVLDVSRYPDISQLIGASDALITDYSSCAFDAAFAKIPVFIYADDIQEYIENRGTFMWKREELPFSVSEDEQQLKDNILEFNITEYKKNIDKFMEKNNIIEDGNASKRVADTILKGGKIG